MGESDGYQPILSFEEWSDAIPRSTDPTEVDAALERLAAVRHSVGATDDEISAKRSLLLAALHTGAVEGIHRMNRGVTLTALGNVLDWQRFVEDSEGSDARRHVEAALRAYDLAVDAARDDEPPITQAWIRRVHEEACAAQKTVIVRTPVGEQTQPLRLGEYKTSPNHVLLADGRLHHYAPPADVVPEMERLVDELRSRAYIRAHAVVQAAYAHHALTQIHPFQDGNGRVARVLASVPLLRRTSLPFHLYEDQVGEYFGALARADDGEPGDFVRFTRERTQDLALLTADQLVAETPVAFPDFPDDRTRERAQLIANRLRGLVETAIAETLESASLPAAVGVFSQGVMGFNAGTSDPAGRRTSSSENPSFTLLVKPTGARDTAWFALAVDYTLRSPFPYALWHNWTGEPLELRMDDVHPEVRRNARLRITAFIERALTEHLLTLRLSLAD